MTALTAGPLTPGPVVADEVLEGTSPIVGAQYAASYSQYAHEHLAQQDGAPITPVTSSQFQLSASPTHLLLEVGWLTKPLYTVQFDFGGFQRLQFL